MKKSEIVISVLLSLIKDMENDWNRKEREAYTMSKLLEIPWLKDGSFYTNDKKNRAKLKKIYFEHRHSSFTSSELGGGYFIIHEPFGSKSSPDYLLITPNGILGIEDKSNKKNKIEWNSGTPGQDKIITFFQKGEKKVYLFTSWDYNWTLEASKTYDKIKEQVRKYADELYKEKMIPLGPAFSKMKLYSRAHLCDFHNLTNHDETQANVKKLFGWILDGEEHISMVEDNPVYVQGKLF